MSLENKLAKLSEMLKAFAKPQRLKCNYTLRSMIFYGRQKTL